MKAIISVFLLILFVSTAAMPQETGHLPAESFAIDWPDEEKWVLGSSQSSEKMEIIELIHEGETFDDWTEMGTMISHKGLILPGLDTYIDTIKDQTAMACPDFVFTEIERKEDCTYPYIIFSIECDKYVSTGTPESQVWFATQGIYGFYCVFRALKVSELSETQKEEFTEFLKTGKIVNQ